ncbi:ubiquinol oxidase subunit II [Dyella nitratireducens]|nr:ubiquinol oxidase subunit II [Dyella nitratireducens]
MPLPNASKTILRVGAAMSCVWLAACHEGVLVPKGPVGAEEKQLLLEALIPMLMVITPIILLTLWFAWWFRAGNARAKYKPRWEYSGYVEFSIWMIPLLVILFLGSLAWVGAHQNDPYKPLASNRKPMTVDVVAMDWRWLFIYPDQGVASVNELAIPVGTPISLRLTSATVMNSFFVPQLGGQIYAMPGMETKLSLLADEPGNYRGLSAQFSGDGFSDMHFQVLATDDKAFNAWLDHVKAQGAALDDATYNQLVARHRTGNVVYYASIAQDLFTHAIDSATRRPVAVTASPAQAGVTLTAGPTER